ncbi:zf-TFIIB domain-containing protein [Altererythrobacter sp. H2]|uniref:TFIIB-type zinc ribbon-containing protein n=1 Tax=Altererythrobacter sp. H2 TaxID=3108391 RepID=UPI002AD841F2|nr:zf-TFIIB domain-containing protein [Altererythrobacter sp. H2]MDZ7894762.1 zf-TFIIB domain-containing protein [Sphingobium sp.]WRK94667.1 zf-TFIIB domain-containing protein [Altererythrobacter sp. H2]
MSSNHGPMACPLDGTTLVMSERSGIEIDYCPTCRGVWLDRGELDKIIERSIQPTPAPTQPAPAQPGYDRGHQQGHSYPPRKRKKSFLEELFD